MNKHAFTMLELTFVIVIIGILSAVAIPKFSSTRTDAEISKAKATIVAVRNAVAAERQSRILKGKFDTIKKLHKTQSDYIFDFFDNNSTVLQYPLKVCSLNDTACWITSTVGDGSESSPTQYIYVMPLEGSVTFSLINNKFDCNREDARSGDSCKLLTQ